MKYKILIFTFLCAISFLIVPPTLAQYDYTPMEKIPGTTEDISAFPDYIKAIYKFALWSVGIAALLMVSVGGFMYFSAAGNTSKLDKAKIVIRDSIFGIVAVLTAYLLLYTINPDLVGVSLSGLSNLGNSANASVSFQPASPSQGTINSNFTTHINIIGNGNYALESLTISGIDSSNYTSSLSNNTITVTVPSSQLELGTYRITATILDQDNNSHTSENLSFKIISDSSQLAIATLGLNEGIVNKEYSQLIQAEGGTGSYTISVSGLPNGLTFNSSDDTIIGTPAQAGTYPTTITVNDGTDAIEKEFSLNIREGDYSILPPDCASECEDGDTQCTSGGYIQYCGNYDNDICLEFGPPEACSEGERCVGDSCGWGGEIPNDGIPLVDAESGFQEGGVMQGGTNVHCSGGQPVYYKFVGCILDEQHGIQIIGTPYSNTGGARSIVLKRGSPPTVEEIKYMNSATNTSFDGVNWQQISYNPTVYGWIIPKPAGYEDTYIKSRNAGYTGIMLNVIKPTPKSLWYVAFYSPEDTTLGHISITAQSSCP